MAPKTKEATPLGKAVIMTLGTLFLSLTPPRPVGAEILYAETAPMSFEVWAADLAPGFFLQEQTINDRLCYCKKPGGTGPSSVFTSFSFNTPSPLTSSGVPGSSFEYMFITQGDQMQLTFKPPQNDTATTRKGTSTTPEATTSPQETTTATPVDNNKHETTTTTTTPEGTSVFATTTPPQKLTTSTVPPASSTSTSTVTTSTKPQETTTSAARTTTPVPSSTTCGQCNQEYTIGDANFMDIIDWKSPGWDQGQNYPDGCTCTLKVHVRLSQWGYFVYDFAAGSNIKALNNCAYDRMEVNLNGNKDIWCDANMSKYSGGEYTTGVPQDYTFTFISDAGDGNQVAAGFSLTIQAYNFGRHL